VIRPAGWFAQLVQSGEYHRLAAQCTSDVELAERLGCTADAIQNARARLRRQGVAVPTVLEVRFGAAAVGLAEEPQDSTYSGEGDITECDNSDFADEEPTQQRAALPVAEPPLPAMPKGFAVRHISTLVDGVTGETKQQWIKTSAQNDERLDWLQAIRDSVGPLPDIELSSLPTSQDRDLLAVYPVGDPHIGLLAWHEDAGENFDMDIAERNLVSAFKHLVDLAPSAHEALLIFIGDNAHADGQSNTTTKGTRVDVDGRTVKMARTTIQIGRRAVDLALQKHGRVRLIWERGNHDELIAAMTALAFSLIYESEPRVSVDVSPEMFHWFRFGANLIGTHHGDKVKPMDLLGVMAVDRQQDWGETKHRRFYLGHYHHQMVKEVPGLICEYLPTLASSDAWHRSMGYRSQRAMYMDVFHRERGHVNRHIVGIDHLREVAV
jgi:hypothetical protein